MPLVTIILPIYNVEQYLRQALDSCVNQILKDIVNYSWQKDCKKIFEIPYIISIFRNKKNKIVILLLGKQKGIKITL